MDNNKEIYLRKNIIMHDDITPEGISVYCALRKLYNINEDEYYISIKQIAFILTGRYEFQSRFIDSVKYGFNNLIDLNLVSVIHKLSNTEYIVDLSQLYYEYTKGNDDYYTVIYDNELKDIMNSNKNTFKLLKYFILLISTISTTYFTYTNDNSSVCNFVGDCTVDYLSKLSNISIASIVNSDNGYNKVLEHMKLLYIYRNDDFYIKDGKPQAIRNFYGRYKDLIYIKKYAEEYADSKESIKCNKKKTQIESNKDKSMLMKYNSLCKGDGNYSEADIRLIYKFILEYNEKYKDDEDKIKDVDIFNNYNF